jgi:glutathione S-transferase
VFWALVRTQPEKRDMAKLALDAVAAARVWSILDTHLAGRDWVEGAHFTIADIALGAYARRYLGLDGIERPVLPHLAAWFERVCARTAFQRHIAPAMT